MKPIKSKLNPISRAWISCAIQVRSLVVDFQNHSAPISNFVIIIPKVVLFVVVVVFPGRRTVKLQ